MDENQELRSHYEHPDTSPKSSTVKRRRPPLSCTVCRRRKLKCDRELPCSQCVKSKTPELCVYTGPGAGHVESGSDRAHVSRTRISPTHSGLNVFDSKIQSTNRVTKPRAHVDEVQELRNRVQILENALSRTGSVQALESLPGDDSPVFSDSGPPTGGEEHYLTEDVKTLPWPCFRGKRFKTRFCGRCHSVLSIHFVKDIGDFLRAQKSKHKKDSEYKSMKKFRGELWSKERHEQQQGHRERGFRLEEMLPPRRAADELLHLYLSNFETTYRILHIPTFLKQYEAYWASSENPDTVFIAKLLALMAASSCFYDLTTKLNGKDSLQKIAIGWIQGVQSWIASSSVNPNMDLNMLQIQCLLLIARQAVAVDGDTVWISSGSLIRSAMAIGLHRNPLRFGKVPKFWAEIRRRLWATILELDLQSSLDGGMPPFIDLDEYDCDPPSNYDDADLTEDMTEDPVPKDPHILTQSSFQILLCRSLPIRVQIAKLVNSLKFTMSYDEALRLSEALVRSMQEGLVLFPDERSMVPIPGIENASFTKSFFMFLMRRYLLVLHRPFCLSILRTPKFSYSRKVCLESALEMISQLEPPCVDLHDVHNAQPYPHLGQLRGGMFREELFHAAMTVLIELFLQAEEYSRSKPVLPVGSSALNSLTEMVQSQQAVMVRAVENTVELFGRRISPSGNGCKPYLFLNLALGSVKARLSGQDPFTIIEQYATKTLRHCQIFMKEACLADTQGRDEGGGSGAPTASTPGFNASTPLDLQFNNDPLLSSSMMDALPLEFGSLFDMPDYGVPELWSNDFLSGI